MLSYPENRKCFIKIMYWIKKVNCSFSNDMKIENIKEPGIKHNKTKAKLDY